MSLETEEATSGGFSDAEDNNVAGYKAVHWLAIAALALGLFSLLALATRFLWFAPAIAVGVSVVAVVLTRPTQDRYTGRWLAVVGLVLGAFAMACAPIATMSRNRVLYSAAADFGANWLRLVVDGQDQLAHQYTLDSSNRQLNDDLTVIYKPTTTGIANAGRPGGPPTDRYSEMVEFMSQDILQDLKECGKGAQIELLENVSIDVAPSTRRDLVRQVYRVTPTDGGEPVDVGIAFQRQLHTDAGKALWQVLRCTPPSEQ